MNDLAVGGDADRARSLDDALHVVLADLAVGARDGDDASRVLGPDVRAAQRDDHGFDALAGHALGRHGGELDGRDGFVEVDNDALAQPVAARLAYADDADSPADVIRLGDDHGDPACAQVETDGFLPP